MGISIGHTIQKWVLDQIVEQTIGHCNPDVNICEIEIRYKKPRF